jgi:HSP20 family protein
MSLQRFDPFREALTLRDAMNRLFEESFVRPGSAPSGQLGTGYGLAIDLEESPEGYTVRASLPGFKPEDVNVQLVGDTLSISAQSTQEQERGGEGGNYLLKERRFGSVSRTITLPQRVQADQAQARFEHGELVLTLPKAEENKPRQIKIDVQGRQELAGGTAPRTEETGQEARQSLSSEPATPAMNQQSGAVEQSQEQTQ